MSLFNQMPVKTANFSSFCDALQEGKVCVFETDTVVGIGCVAFISNNNRSELNLAGIKKIFSIKDRVWDKKLPWLVKDFETAKQLSVENIELASDIAETNWPGATTIILKANESICNEVTQNSTIAFRCPDVRFLLDAMQKINSPIVCTSANFSGEEAVAKIDLLSEKFLQKADFVYLESCDVNPSGIASSIYDCSNNSVKKLR